MTHQDVDDASALSGLLAQIPADKPIDTIGGDVAYDTKQCHKAIAGRGATPSIAPREGAKPWREGTPEQAGAMRQSTTSREMAEANGRRTVATADVR
ncbi:hypothetical protein LJR029_002847 [Caballeronia sp. LjRoot29]